MNKYTLIYLLIRDCHFHFNSRCLGEPELSSSPLVFFLHVILQENLSVQVARVFIQTRCPFCQPTISVKALKETLALTPTMEKHQLVFMLALQRQYLWETR